MRFRAFVQGFRIAMIVAAAATAAFFVMVSAAWSQSVLGGEYVGVGQADGMAISLYRSGAGYGGTLTGANQRMYAIQPEARGEKAEGVLEHESGAGFYRFAPHPSGLIMVWLPLDSNRRPEPHRVASLIFVPRGTPIPPMPTNPAEPPRYYGERVDALDFLENYPFWEAEDVAEGYGVLRDKYRALIELFPRVQADILWKLCQAPVTSPAASAIAAGLRGNDVTCAEALSFVEAGRSNGRHADFVRRMADERKDLTEAVKCARGMGRVHHCRTVAQRTSAYAMSLETPASVLRALR